MTQTYDLTGNTIKADGFDGSVTGNVTATSIKVGTPTITSGAGAPSMTGTKGSVYLRTDGTADTTLYVNASGSTTWTALTST